MNADVAKWLDAPADFAAGVALYQVHGTSAAYLHLFRLGETSFSRQVLVRELGKLVATPAPVLPKQPEVVVARPEPRPLSDIDVGQSSPATEPPDAVPVRAQLRALRDERSRLHAQLTAPGMTNATRLQHALRILDIGDEVLKTEQLLAHVLQHGALPAGPVATADVTDAGELRRRLDNLVSLRSKVRRNEKRAAELPAIEQEIKLIREKLTPIVS